MTRLKLADLANEKPVRLTLEIPARLHRDLTAYALAVNGGDSKGAPSVERLIPAMLERFIATDRAFSKARRSSQAG
ncbi:DUF2274 domain-containing protein [Sphingobium xenophagum]|jgi:hypothetical protein|uniref:DUF2274 domain-containing protein n=1 Tax=Sphingobium xenophagum TaxID=121428 RepID=UPI000380B039|nr:DUF2274 domain-containing protein [Sphingobium xenophagum]MCA0405127.1 DUF2274 domain-containing protein [Pseudomonadota bacterium]